MRKLALALAAVAIGVLTVVATTALADRGHGGNGGNRFSAKLIGFEETPSESTPGRGTLRATGFASERAVDDRHLAGPQPADGVVAVARPWSGARCSPSQPFLNRACKDAGVRVSAA